MIVEFSQNGYIRREFEVFDTTQARVLVSILNARFSGRGGWYCRSYKRSRYDGLHCQLSISELAHMVHDRR